VRYLFFFLYFLSSIYAFFPLRTKLFIDSPRLLKLNERHLFWPLWYSQPKRKLCAAECYFVNLEILWRRRSNSTDAQCNLYICAIPTTAVSAFQFCAAFMLSFLAFVCLNCNCIQHIHLKCTFFACASLYFNNDIAKECVSVNELLYKDYI